jgi:hypothetical protein
MDMVNALSFGIVSIVVECMHEGKANRLKTLTKLRRSTPDPDTGEEGGARAN